MQMRFFYIIQKNNDEIKRAAAGKSYSVTFNKNPPQKLWTGRR